MSEQANMRARDQAGDSPLAEDAHADVEGRSLAEHELLEAQRLESIGRLAGGVAHDVNNMLSAIRGFAELLHEDLERQPQPPTEELRRSVEAIRGAADTATALTAQLLAFSRGRARAPVPLNLAIAVRNLEPTLRSLIGEQVQLVIRSAPSTGTVRADPGQVDQVLVNLTMNARDAMPHGGTARIETSNVDVDGSHDHAIGRFELPPGQYVMLAVSDTGKGLDLQTPGHSFDPFLNATEQGRGTGLGMAAIHDIARQSEGHFRLHSETGQGATFSLFLPRIELTQEEAQAPAPPEARSQSGTVLVVEDDAAVREYITRVLERKGFRVIGTPNAAEAWSALESGEPIEVLVADVVMPGLSGSELASQVVADGRPMGLVLVSGYTAENLDVAELLERGAIFVAKPFTSLDLSRAVAAAMASPLSARG
jgi:two-component system cell cycle sensor histidine kinase/response regulator CckA